MGFFETIRWATYSIDIVKEERKKPFRAFYYKNCWFQTEKKNLSFKGEKKRPIDKRSIIFVCDVVTYSPNLYGLVSSHNSIQYLDSIRFFDNNFFYSPKLKSKNRVWKMLHLWFWVEFLLVIVRNILPLKLCLHTKYTWHITYRNRSRSAHVQPSENCNWIEKNAHQRNATAER